jgi:hypothetical protein
MIYSLLDLHKLRSSVPGTERQTCLSWASAHYTCIVDSLVTTASTIPHHIVHENSNNILKQGGAEAVQSLVLRGNPIPVHTTTPSETESPYQKTQAVIPPQSLVIGSWGLPALRWSGEGGAEVVRKDESLLTAQGASQVQIVTPHMQNDEPGHMSCMTKL